MTNLRKHTIVITPIGNPDQSLINHICRGVGWMCGFRTEVVKLLTDIEFAFDPGRKQYASTTILERLAIQAPSYALKVLGLTNVDLFIPILTHVYGEAQLGGKACIVSTFRLSEGLIPISGHETYSNRVVKEAIHELGHTFNLRHCPDMGCNMHYCRSIHDVDKKKDHFCRYCSVLFHDELRRLGIAEK